MQVGDAPPRRIPITVRVAGSPLLLQKDRVSPPGLAFPTFSAAVDGAAADGAAIITGTAPSSSCANSAAVSGSRSSGSKGPQQHAGQASASGSPPYGSARVWGQERGGLEVQLDLGKVPVGVGQRRAFFVRNHACAAMALEWRLEKVEGSGNDRRAATTSPDGPSGGNDGSGGDACGEAAARAINRGAPLCDVSVEPRQAVIPPGQLQRFTVRVASDAVACHSLRLVGRQHIATSAAGAAPLHDACQPQQHQPGRQLEQHEQPHQQGRPLEREDVSPTERRILAWLAPTGCLARPLGLQLLGGFYHNAGAPPALLPDLLVRVRATTAGCRLALASGCAGLDWACQSVWPDAHPGFVQQAVLRNAGGCPLAFRLGVEGPFELLHAVLSVPPATQRQHELFCSWSSRDSSLEGPPTPPPRIPGGSAAAAGAQSDRWLCLPPQESATVALRFKPRLLTSSPAAAAAAAKASQEVERSSSQALPEGGSAVSTANGSSMALPSARPCLALRDGDPSVAGAAAATVLCFGSISGGPSGPRQDYSTAGSLVVSFGNGERQLIPLVAHMVHPSVEASPPVLSFGAVHPQAPKPLMFVLQNDTAADAAWCVVDAAAASAAHCGPAAMAAAAAGGGAMAAAGAALSPCGSGCTQQPATLSGSGCGGYLAPSGPGTNSVLIAAAVLTSGGLAAGHQQGVPDGSGRGGSAVFGTFSVSPASGVIPGRGLGMPRSQRVVVTFAPQDAAPAAARLWVAVAAGRGCSLQLEGQGSYNEALEHQYHLTLL
jgi:hypothetical protein